MGTSSMYTGPSKNPLLPNDFEDSGDSKSSNGATPPNEEKKQDNVDGVYNSSVNTINTSKSTSSWRRAKNAITRYASGNSKNYKGALSRYVKAHGGAKAASASAKSGIKTTVNVGRFFNNVSSQGFKETLTQAKIDYVGKTVKEILNEVINYLAPIPVTKEDAVARKALISTMEILYEKLEIEGKDITTLENIDKETLNAIIPLQIESYIYERIINDLGSRIETKSSSPADAISKEREIKEYINSKVETTFSGKDFSTIDYNDKNIEKEVEGLFTQCYKVMEDML
jgi:hypothetical protein